MKEKVVIGLDTSNYTTSCAICSLEGKVLENYKILLPVKEGESGLRQSDAVFAHIKNFQKISEIIKEKNEMYEVKAIGYSAYPRDVKGSYMPCFMVGKTLAEMISSIFNIPVYFFSHQAGHIRAALYSSQLAPVGKFLAFHVSGGTTEIVCVTPNDASYDIDLIGGSIDLHMGQAIDRIGVKMGLSFPCGKQIEQLAMQNNKKLPPVRICVNGLNCNLSGLENLSTKLYDLTNDKPQVSAYVISFVAQTIIKLTENLRKQYSSLPIVYAGGVMSNKIVQSKLKEKFDNVYFAEPEFSTDNAVGIALLTMKKL